MSRLLYNLQQRFGKYDVVINLKIAKVIDKNGNIINFIRKLRVRTIRLASSSIGEQGKYPTPLTTGSGSGGDFDKVTETFVVNRDDLPKMSQFADSDLAITVDKKTIVFNGSIGTSNKERYVKSLVDDKWQIVLGELKWLSSVEYGVYTGTTNLTLYKSSTLEKQKDYKQAIELEVDNAVVKVRRVLFDFESQGLLLLEAERIC